MEPGSRALGSTTPLLGLPPADYSATEMEAMWIPSFEAVCQPTTYTLTADAGGQIFLAKDGRGRRYVAERERRITQAPTPVSPTPDTVIPNHVGATVSA